MHVVGNGQLSQETSLELQGLLDAGVRLEAIVHAGIMWARKQPLGLLRGEVTERPGRHGALLRAWREVVGDGRATLASLLDEDRVRAAFLAYDPTWTACARSTIGHGLKSLRGRVADGLRLERVGMTHGAATWAVRQVATYHGQPPPPRGSGGSTP